MRVGERIAEQRRLRGWSQSRLAREAKLSQGTIGKLEAGISSGSSHLHRIARALQTSAAYLAGETNDPAEGAPLPPSDAAVVHIMLPVALPDENALARMFEGLLDAIDRSAPVGVLARELAQLLPTGLQQLKATLPGSTRSVRQPGKGDPAGADVDRAMTAAAPETRSSASDARQR